MESKHYFLTLPGWKPKAGSITVEVRIVRVSPWFGGRDVLVTPVHGTGEVWVSKFKLEERGK